MIEFILNNETIKTEQPSGTLLLDLIRYQKALTGTKIGCREGDCGACTVLVGSLVEGSIRYESITSCLTPIGNVNGKHVVTIEGLNMKDLSPVQQAMIDESGTQCGFCTVGFVVSLSSYCLSSIEPTDEGAIEAIDGNICRCTGYKSIERAAQRLVQELGSKDVKDPMKWLVKEKFIPAYFENIPGQLAELNKRETIEAPGQTLVGGGTDLYVQRPESLTGTEVSSVSDKPELRFISSENGRITMGGGSTVSDLAHSEEFQGVFPRLSDHVKLVSSTPIRNLSTVAGNFVNASPIGDFTIFFLALDAQLTLQNGSDRDVALKDFYKGYKDLDKSPDEVVSQISFEAPYEGQYFNFEKVSKRENLDIASVNSAVLITTDGDQITDVHVSAGGVAPIPKYLAETRNFLVGKSLSAETVREAASVLNQEIAPISDARGSADYKRLLARQLFFAHFITLFPKKFEMEALR